MVLVLISSVMAIAIQENTQMGSLMVKESISGAQVSNISENFTKDSSRGEENGEALKIT